MFLGSTKLLQGVMVNSAKSCTITHVFLAQRSQIISLMHPRLLTIVPYKENVIC